MASKHVFRTIDDFQGRAGQVIARSDPIEITREAMAQFCASVDNREWIHRDLERCKAAGLGGLIAPGFMVPALFSKAFFALFDVSAFRSILFSGTDRIRLLAPIPVPGRVAFEIGIDRAEQRSRDIAVFYDAKWFVDSRPDPAGVGVFVIRYC